MSEIDDFLTKTLARQIKAETALHNGEPDTAAGDVVDKGPGDPVRGTRAVQERNGRSDPDLPLGRVAVLHCVAYSFDLVAAGVSGDLAYTVGYERSQRSEDGEWKTVHRHGDFMPVDQSQPAEASTT